MGRGLSQLQQFILHRASGLKQLYFCDILEGYFKFEPTGWYTEKINGKRVLGRWREGERGEVGQIKGAGSRLFAPKEIGERKYAVALSCLSRACTRLAKRGLV